MCRMIKHSNFLNETGQPVRNTVLDLGIKKYYLGPIIGEGTYSKVCTAIMKSSQEYHDRKVACKIINKKNAGADFVKKFLPREIRIMKTISHPHIISVLDIVEVCYTVYMLMGYCKYGDLLEYIRNKGPISEKKTKSFFKQIVSAIHYLHRIDIAHRDLKCENILMCSKNSVKVGDFGFARLCRNEYTGNRVLSDTFCGSAAYAAPEIIQGSPYNPKMFDVWSLGCILYIMLTAQMPFDDTNIKKMLRYQQNRMICFSICYNMRVTDELKDLLLQILEPDVMKRATIGKVAKSKWFTLSPVQSSRKN